MTEYGLSVMTKLDEFASRVGTGIIDGRNVCAECSLSYRVGLVVESDVEQRCYRDTGENGTVYLHSMDRKGMICGRIVRLVDLMEREADLIAKHTRYGHG